MDTTTKKITHNGNQYAVINLDYNDNNIPLVVDWKDYKIIRGGKSNWRCNQSGFVSCMAKIDGKDKEVFIHEAIMALKLKEAGDPLKYVPILHINRIGIDNRRENLLYDTRNKETNKNNKKKKRTIKLPKDSGIDPDELPTYVWYLRPNDTHGERFIVEVGDLSWKTTSSKKLSLRYKLEEAKKYLRELKETKPELFEDYSMNGEFNANGKQMFDTFYDIIYEAGYKHIKKLNVKDITDKYLEPKTDEISDDDERLLLKAQNLVVNGGRKKILESNKTSEKSEKLPKYCLYKAKTNDHGDYFIVSGHPDQKGKAWKTTSSKSVSTQDKYKNMLNYLTELNGIASSSSSSPDLLSD